MELFQNLIKKLMALVGALFLLMLVVFFGALYFDRIWKPEAEKPIQEWNPDVLVLSNPEVSEQVKKGYLLLSSSSQNMGPLQENPSLRYA